jgi:hypothetical protein
MKLKTLGVGLIAGLMMSVAGAWAGPVGIQKAPSAAQQQATLAQLDAQKDQVSREMLKPGVKGPLWASYSDRYTQLDRLIGRIQSGQSVSPHEIDAALQPVHR